MKHKYDIDKLIKSGKSIDRAKKPFVNYTLDEDKRTGDFITISMKLNLEEQGQLVKDKKILHQPKNSTAIKQMMRIGSKVVHDPKMVEYLEVVLGNLRRNKERGIVDN